MPTFGSQTFPNLVFTQNKPITPVTLPAATGGDPPLMYGFLAPNIVPGLTLDATTHVLSGTPRFPGTFPNIFGFTYLVRDSDGDQVFFPPDFTIGTEPDTTPTFGTATIPDQTYTADTAVNVTLPTATFGNRALTYTLTPALPDGLTFDGTANPPTITGTPAAAIAQQTHTYTVTDDDGSTADLTFTIGPPSAGTERALEKTLAAFGRAFATGTVGVFEDYLTNTGASANTSHFTIGGHKFDLAAVGTGRDLSALAHLNRSGNPVQTLPAQPDCRAQGCARGAGNRSFPAPHRGARGVFPPQTRVTRTTMSAKDLLMKSAFHFNLNDAATATSGWSLWARATTTNFDGKPEDDFEQDGDVTSTYLGTDYRTPNGIRLGLAISETSGEIDYDDQADDIQGDLDADLTSILPYIQWQPTDTTNAWVVLGYGEGDAELSTDGDDETTDVDIEMQMIAAGVSGDLTTYKRSEWSWKASAFAVELESEADEEADLPAVTADSQRLRLAMQGRVPGEITADGAQFTPNWELGLRWDDGDAEQGGGADLGLGFDYRHPASGLSMQGKANALVAHEEEDYDEWDASLQLRFDPGTQGRGITFTLEPDWTKNGRSQKMGMDLSNALGKWSKRGLRLELTGERTEKTDDNIGHNIRLTGSLHF